MADNTFIIEIRSKGFGPAKSNTKALKGSIARLRQEVSKHKKALDQAKIGSKNFHRAQKELELSTNKLDEGLKKVTGKIAGYSREAGNMRGVTAGLRRSVGALRNNLLLVSFTIGALIHGVKKFVDAAAGFEAVKTRLVGLTGSVKAASKAFDTFNTIAATTPFSLQDVVEAGAQLKAFGADAEALIKPISDLAAFMGTTAVEAANAFGRAFAGGAGAADILRERGILNIIKTSRGLEDLSKTTLPEFRKALIETLQDPTVGIIGSTDRLSKTYVGAMSNMQDAMTRASAAMGDLLIPAFTSLAKSIGEAANRATDFFKKLSETDFETATRHVQELGVAFDGLGVAKAKVALDAANESLKSLEDTISKKLTDSMASTGVLMSRVSEEAVNMRKAFDLSIVGPAEFAGSFEDLGDIASIELAKVSDALAKILIVPESKRTEGMVDDLSKLSKEYDTWAELSALVAQRNKFIDDQKESIKDLKNEVFALNTEIEGVSFDDLMLPDEMPTFFFELERPWEEAMHALDVKIDEDLENIAFKLSEFSGDELLLPDFDIEESFPGDEFFIKQGEHYRQVAADFNSMAVQISEEDTERLKKSTKGLGKTADETARVIGQMGNAIIGLAASMKSGDASIGDYIAALGQIVALVPGAGAAGAGMSIFGQLLNVGSAHKGGLVTPTGIQTFQAGGMIQGGDDVPILAQGGEFVMNRDAVSNIGLQRLALMNETDSMGPGGNEITLNISAPLVDEHIVDIIIPALKNAVSLDLA